MNPALKNILGKTIRCSCEKTHNIPTKEVLLGKNVVNEIGNFVVKWLKTKNVTLIADTKTFKVAGNVVVNSLNSKQIRFDTIIIPDNKKYGCPIVDDKTVDIAIKKSKSKFVISLGSGSINDISKMVATKKDGSYITIPTAASMNGYTSSIIAILSKGLKHTLPANPPIAVLADINILAAAPIEMIRAGLGDLMSKPVCGSDWKLSNIINNEYWCKLPGEIVEVAEKQCRSVAKQIGQRDIKSIEVLTEGLLLSGISMTIAGSSAPASGGEHLISHYWDITAAHEGRIPNLHGAQVGVATILTSNIYEHLAKINPETINITKLLSTYLPWDKKVCELKNLHTYLSPHIIPEVKKKYLTSEQQRAKLKFIKNNWTKIWKALNSTLLPAKTIEQTLVSAYAPVTAHELGITKQKLLHTLLVAKDIRARYTILDFAADLGVLKTIANKIV